MTPTKSTAERVNAHRARQKKEVILLRPAVLEMTDLMRRLTGKENAYAIAEKALLVYTYLFSRAFNTTKNSGFDLDWTQLHSDYWRAIAGSTYNLLRDRMVATGLLEMRTVNETTGEVIEKGTYKVSNESTAGVAKQYRIPSTLLGTDTYFMKTPQPAGKVLVKKLAALNKPLVEVQLDTYREHVASNMRKLVLVDSEASRQAVAALWTSNGLPTDAAAFIALFNASPLKNVVMDAFGHRIHSDVVSLKKSLFPFLRYADDQESELEEIDLVNSQPALFAVITPGLIRELVPECREAIPFFEAIQDQTDYLHYRELCTSGAVYEHLMAQWNATWSEAPIDRNRAKELYYIAAFSNYTYLNGLSIERLVATLQTITLQELTTEAGRQRKNQLQHQLFSARSYALFKREFPSLVDLFAKLKQLDWSAFNPSKEGAHTNNCLLAQRFESALVFGHLVKILMTNGIDQVWTKHDAIVVKKQDADRARTLLCAFFAKRQLGLKLKPKSHSPATIPMTTQTEQTIPTAVFHTRVPEPRGTIRVFRSYDELPDKWKKVLAQAQPTPAGPAVPVPAGPVPAAKQYQYSDFF